MGLYGKIKAMLSIAAVLAAMMAVPCFATDKSTPPEDNDATYQLPMYIPKVIQEKMVYFGEDNVGNDELYTMEEPVKKPVPVQDNDSSYTLPGEYSPTRNKIKPQIPKPAPAPVQPQPAPQPVYQQPAPQQQYYPPQQIQQPVQQQPAPQAQQPRNNNYYYQKYDYYDQNDNVAPSNQGTNYPSYYQ
jgi:outer membrane biosynthesis protein TonB